MINNEYEYEHSMLACMQEKIVKNSVTKKITAITVVS